MRSGTTWTQQAKLTASDAATGDRLGLGSGFGYSVSISGRYLVDGAHYEAGAAYVLVRSGTSWTQQAKLAASDAAAGDYFGTSVGITGQYLVAGAYGNGAGGGDAGAAYVFFLSGTTWTEQTKLTASDTAGREFGISVSISGEYVVAGAYYEDAGGYNAGAAYMYGAAP